MYTTLPSPESDDFTYGLQINEPVIVRACVGVKLKTVDIADILDAEDIDTRQSLAGHRRNLNILDGSLRIARPEPVGQEIQAVVLPERFNGLFKSLVEGFASLAPEDEFYVQAAKKVGLGLVDLTVASAKDLQAEIDMSETQARVRAQYLANGGAAAIAGSLRNPGEA